MSMKRPLLQLVHSREAVASLAEQTSVRQEEGRTWRAPSRVVNVIVDKATSTVTLETETIATHDEAMADTAKVNDTIEEMRRDAADLRAFVREGIADTKVRSAEMDARFTKLNSAVSDGLNAIRADFAEMRSSLSDGNTEIANLKTYVADTSKDSMKWVIATILGVAVATISVLGLILRAPTSTAATAQPSAPQVIVLQMPEASAQAKEGGKPAQVVQPVESKSATPLEQPKPQEKRPAK